MGGDRESAGTMGSTIIRGLKVGVDYKFQVRAVNAYGDKGEPSPEIIHTAPKDETAPAVPASVSIGVQGKHIHVEVPKQTEDDFAGFEFHASPQRAALRPQTPP